ncbi:hypothetical protein ACP4OV_030012 [Aristida adscensionis]
MAISSYQSAGVLRPGSFDGNTTTAVVEYDGAALSEQRAPALPAMPELNATAAARAPLAVDTGMFVAVGLDFAACEPAQTSCNTSAGVVTATMNNQSLALPRAVSTLDTPGRAYTRDFPDRPPVAFDYTNDRRWRSGAHGAAVDEGEAARVQRDGGGGAACSLRRRRHGRGAVQPRRPAGAEHRRRGHRRMGRHPVRRQQHR